ncbi:MAG: DUF362 domain-containing protein [Bacteroides sp.]|nr:DUF362 domain-containing protein [Prevotella sp.]MCM1408629.1 DUF362 domain-containing protein [Treponema brennaborense]MCM1470703.1 DUF362 domain-containing protein [Bacteroides sp.]
MTSSVAQLACTEYDPDSVLAVMRQLLALVPPPDVRGKTVLLKPNILLPKKPEAAVCTHPVVVAAAVRAFIELGAKKVLAGESPAVAGSASAAKATGMLAAVEQAGGEWVDFSETVTVRSPDGKLTRSFEFAAPFAQADIVVSIAKLKTHQLMAYTGAMKNLFGLVPGLKKAQTHYRFPDKRDFAAYLTDLNIAAKPAYAIMDAVIGMEGKGGPGNGTPIRLGFLAASDNILALDWACAELVGYNPHQILNLEDALNRRIWLSSPDEITTKGDESSALRPAKFRIVKETSTYINLQKRLPAFVNVLAKAVFVKTPRFDRKKCISCGKCVEICPAHILSFQSDSKKIQKKHVAIDKNKCLHCFCCHEICPVEAISLKRF